MLPSTLWAQRSPDEVIAAYHDRNIGLSTDLVIDFFCQRETTQTPAAMDDLADRMVEFALADPESLTADRIAYHLTLVGSPPESLENCEPFEGAWDALTILYERRANISFHHLLKLDVQRGVEYGLTLLPDLDLKKDKQRMCRLLSYINDAGELALLSDATLAFTTDIEGRYDPSGARGGPHSAQTQALAEELMLEGFIQKTGWPWSPCIGPGTTGFVSGFAEDGTPLPPDTGWVDIQDKRGFYLSPSGDTLRVLKRR